MIGIVNKLFNKLSGDSINKYSNFIQEVNKFENEISSLSDLELKEKTKQFRNKLKQNLTIDEIHKLYSEYVNKSQVNLISKFGFGRDIAVKAEGNSIFTKKNKKILDFTGGIGVLNHGHNHPKILKIRE